MIFYIDLVFVLFLSFKMYCQPPLPLFSFPPTILHSSSLCIHTFYPVCCLILSTCKVYSLGVHVSYYVAPMLLLDLYYCFVITEYVVLMFSIYSTCIFFQHADLSSVCSMLYYPSIYFISMLCSCHYSNSFFSPNHTDILIFSFFSRVFLSTVSYLFRYHTSMSYSVICLHPFVSLYTRACLCKPRFYLCKHFHKYPYLSYSLCTWKYPTIMSYSY